MKWIQLELWEILRVLSSSKYASFSNEESECSVDTDWDTVVNGQLPSALHACPLRRAAERRPRPGKSDSTVDLRRRSGWGRLESTPSLLTNISELAVWMGSPVNFEVMTPPAPILLSLVISMTCKVLLFC